MLVDNYALYLLVAVGYIASPGPAVFVAINGGAVIGVKNTAAILLGNTIGLGILALISALGLGAVMLASEALTNSVKIAGAIWLAYLGVKMIRIKPSETAHAHSNLDKPKTPHRNDHFGRFMDGFILAVTNPKPIIFFVSIYPQFIIANGHQPQQFAALGLTFMGLSFILLNAYSIFSSLTIGKVFNFHRVRLLNWAFGITFIILALFLLMQDGLRLFS